MYNQYEVNAAVYYWSRCFPKLVAGDFCQLRTDIELTPQGSTHPYKFKAGETLKYCGMRVVDGYCVRTWETSTGAQYEHWSVHKYWDRLFEKPIRYELAEEEFKRQWIEKHSEELVEV